MLESLTDVLQPWALCFSMAAQLYIMLAEWKTRLSSLSSWKRMQTPG
jgi:hypothetical protein